jgi:hypothetical protein
MKPRFWVLINFAGILLYIGLASRNWSQENVPIILRDDEDLIRWLEFCLPPLVLATIFNTVYLFLIVRRIGHVGSWKPLISWTLMVAFWIGALKYDRYRFTWERPLSQKKEDEIEHDREGSEKSADSRVKELQAAGVPPFRVDSGGVRYYFLGGTNFSTSSSSNHGLLKNAEAAEYFLDLGADPNGTKIRLI